MARPRPLLYQVRQVKTPYHGKSWKVTAYIGGKRKQHWFASEREAKTFADDSTAELHADQFLAEYETLLLRRVESGELKSGSHKVIKETFVKLKTEFGNRILSEISSTDIERWLDRMSVGMRTKKRHRAYALKIFNAARKAKVGFFQSSRGRWIQGAKE